MTSNILVLLLLFFVIVVFADLYVTVVSMYNVKWDTLAQLSSDRAIFFPSCYQVLMHMQRPSESNRQACSGEIPFCSYYLTG